jgi:hypothetical protein
VVRPGPARRPGVAIPRWRGHLHRVPPLSLAPRARCAPAVAAALLLAGCGPGASAVPAPAPGVPGPSPGTAPAENGPAIAGCPLLPPDHPWNADVSALPPDARSDALLAEMSPGEPLKLALGTIEPHYGIPWAIVPPEQPLVPIAFGTGGMDYSGESDRGPFPIPLDAPIQGGGPGENPTSGDRHLVVVQRRTCLLFEAFNAVRMPGGFRVSAAARWDLRTGARRPEGWTSADAAGLPIFPGLLRWEEVEAGRIDHALRFTLPAGGGSYVHPANHCVASFAPSPPFGLRVRLRAAFDEAPYAPATRVLLRALKRHGMVFADHGSAWSVSGTSHPGFDAVLKDLRLRPIPGSAFEVVALGPVVTGC